jgi:Secretion system C-terminal sorting domain
VQERAEVRLPATTAFRWNKNTVLDLNSHYINYSLSKPYQCEAYINVYTQPKGTAKQEMYAELLPNIFIPIANNGNTIAYQQSVFNSVPDSLFLWGLMGHTHKYGTSYKVWKRLPNGQKGDLLYDASCPQGVPGCLSPFYDYQHIPIRYWTPLLPLKWGHGIIHEAKWVNDGPKSVNFGPTSDDEMMVLIAFYTLKPLAVGTSDPKAAQEPVVMTPNPARGITSVRLPGRSKIDAASLFDATGRLVWQKTDVWGDTVELDASVLPAGVYFVQIDGAVGRLVKL